MTVKTTTYLSENSVLIFSENLSGTFEMSIEYMVARWLRGVKGDASKKTRTKKASHKNEKRIQYVVLLDKYRGFSIYNPYGRYCRGGVGVT